MPDTIRKVDYYYTTVPNKPGEGARVLGILKNAGVNLLSFSAFPSARKSQVDFVPSDAAAFVAAARSEEHTSELQSHSEISYAVFSGYNETCT